MAAVEKKEEDGESWIKPKKVTKGWGQIKDPWIGNKGVNTKNTFGDLDQGDFECLECEKLKFESLESLRSLWNLELWKFESFKVRKV